MQDFSELITNQHILLTLLNKNIPSGVRQSIIKKSNKVVIKQILEIIKNTINGNIPISREKVKKLKRFKTVLRSLTGDKKNLKKKRKLVVRLFKIVGVVLKNFFLSSIWGNILRNVK